MKVKDSNLVSVLSTDKKLVDNVASGMGLAVATAVSALPDWEVHILDLNSEAGSKTAEDLPRTTFHYADVTNYGTLSEAFQKSFEAHNRLDFVFANAGMIERFNFYESHPIGDKVAPPPEPDLLSVDVDLKGVILTTYLAQHYFRASPNQGNGASLVMTSSCGGLYPSLYSPLYSSAKCKCSVLLWLPVSTISPSGTNFYCHVLSNVPISWRRRSHALYRPAFQGGGRSCERHLSRDRAYQPRRSERVGCLPPEPLYGDGVSGPGGTAAAGRRRTSGPGDD